MGFIVDRRGDTGLHVIKQPGEVRTASALHPRRRIVWLQRNDGNFAFAEQYHSVSRHEGDLMAEGWATLPPIGLYASAEIAEAEGRAEMSCWSREET
jgi:hypothetical protein